MGDVPRDRLERGPAGRLAAGASAHAVGHQPERREPLARQLQQLGIREAGASDAHGLVERSVQEMVLIVLPHLARVRDAEEIEILVARLRECRSRVWRRATMCHILNLPPLRIRARAAGAARPRLLVEHQTQELAEPAPRRRRRPGSPSRPRPRNRPGPGRDRCGIPRSPPLWLMSRCPFQPSTNQLSPCENDSIGQLDPGLRGPRLDLLEHVALHAPERDRRSRPCRIAFSVQLATPHVGLGPAQHVVRVGVHGRAGRVTPVVRVRIGRGHHAAVAPGMSPGQVRWSRRRS